MFSAALRRVVPALREKGINVEWGNNRDRRSITITNKTHSRPIGGSEFAEEIKALGLTNAQARQMLGVEFLPTGDIAESLETLRQMVQEQAAA